LAQLKFFDYPWSFWDAWNSSMLRNYQSAFGTMPDLKGRYALGISYAGQPVYEVANDWNPMNPRTPANPNLPITNQGFPFNLLANTPYELNLSGTQRRDSWASTTNNFGPLSDSATAFSTSIDRSFDPAGQHGLNDDAPFSPTDLEKVLRGWDADAGTLPSRLWDVASEFDPAKLIAYDPNRVDQLAVNGFGSNSNAALLAAAQELAGISRRLVTTDSYSLPVANQVMPEYVSDFGADGAPGRRGQANQVLNTPGTDDFQAVMGINRAQAKITDLLRYRVWLEARRYEMNRQRLTEAGIDALSAGNYKTFMDQIKARADFVINNLPNLTSDLLAPEVIAGQRMDLNRPFGDGKDNAGDGIDNNRNGIIDEPSEVGDPYVDGVVDDPMEAGEPFLDINGNGQMDLDNSGKPLEPYIDLNGDKRYEGPRDRLWPELSPTAVGGNGTLAEPISFDYTNGHAEPVYAAIAKSLNVLGGVRNLESQGRQLYARHLYCLMLLLMDENYIAPWDEKDPQINKLLDITIKGSFAQRLRAALGPSPDAQLDVQARAILLRKLTCRTIAQWAANCVDMRDSDVIMTPFEYDENPWDGWGEWDDNWNRDPVNDITNFAKSTFLPLDGDPATNENDAWVIDWTLHTPPNPGRPKTLVQLRANQGQPISTTNPPIITVPFNQTRGTVWGAERPELLITETLAWHDRRTEDRQGDSPGKHDEMHGGTAGADAQHYPDIDMDQRLRPKGSLFVELYNPWSSNGQFPAELYSRFDSTTKYSRQPTSGVDLSRVSNFGVSETYNNLSITDPNAAILTTGPSGFDNNTNRITKRSPVWRLIVVDDWPRARNRNRAKIGNGQSQTGGNSTANGAAQFAGYSQRVGDAPPEVKVNLPLGVTLGPTGVPTYLAPMVADVEAWDATKPPPYRAPDPDFVDVFSAGFFNAAGVFTKFDSGFNGTFTPSQLPQVAGNEDYPNKFSIEYPYIEREFYFTTDNSPTLPLGVGKDFGQFIAPGPAAGPPLPTRDWDYRPNSFRLRIPDRYIKMSGLMHPTDRPTDAADPRYNWARSQKFIPISLEQQKATNRAVLAPILPGRYGVIGTAGTRYFKDANQNIYTDPIGRPQVGNTKYTDDDTLANSLKPEATQQARRIEMRPNSNPDLQQLIVASNGGDPKDQIQKGDTYDPYSTEIGRDNELIRNDKKGSRIENITMPDNNGKPMFYQPCVAIPVEGMSASDPPWGWGPRETQAAGQESDIAKQQADEHNRTNPGDRWPDPTPDKFDYKFDPTAADGEGGYKINSGDASYDKPFDVAPELMRTGTTPNYRTTHLQRLANPELPWNPLPGQYKDAAGTDLYRPNLPVNPYRTIDSSTVNLTAFNGTSSEEHAIGMNNGLAVEEGKLRPWESGAGAGVPELRTYVDGLRGDDTDPTHSAKQTWSFRSVERGFWSRLSALGWVNTGTGTQAPNQGVSTPQRILWTQEPALVDLRWPWRPSTDLNPTAQLLDLVAGRQMTMRFDELPQGQASDNKEFGDPSDKLNEDQKIMHNHCDAVLKHSLGFGNETFGLLYDRAYNPAHTGVKQPNRPAGSSTSSAPPMSGGAALASAIGAPAPSRFIFQYDLNTASKDDDPNGGKLWHEIDSTKAEPITVSSTYPWLEWDNRPYVSADELLNVPMKSQSRMLRAYSTIDPNLQSVNLPNPYGLAAMGFRRAATPVPNATRWLVMQAPFGNLANVFASSVDALAVQQGTFFLPGVADVARDPATGAILPDANGNPQPYGAPNFNRILEYVQVPSRYVGTDTLLNAETFNDVPTNLSTTEPVGADMAAAQLAGNRIEYDARYFFQPPFNKVSRERDPGRVNLNTVTGRRIDPNATTPVAQIWSEVYDGIMHRFHDRNLLAQDQPGHFGPAWRDVVLSRRGYAQFNADNIAVPVERQANKPDVFEAGLNPLFPTIFANPFRSPDAGDLVPLVQMVQSGVDASMLRKHPYDRALDPAESDPLKKRWLPWGQTTPKFGDARDAGLGANEAVSVRSTSGAIPNDNVSARDTLPLFSESRDQPFADTNRNPYMMYQPMSRLRNLVTNRSGVYAVWITVGYFEVEKAPDWNDPDTTKRTNIRAHFGGTLNDNAAETIAALAVYNRAYPDGYMLGKELGSETGDVKRPRGFYIIDRTEEVGFKPGEDLNVEKAVRLRRRIE
jgi:hypothetical protein